MLRLREESLPKKHIRWEFKAEYRDRPIKRYGNKIHLRELNTKKILLKALKKEEWKIFNEQRSTKKLQYAFIICNLVNLNWCFCRISDSKWQKKRKFEEITFLNLTFLLNKLWLNLCGEARSSKDIDSSK